VSGGNEEREKWRVGETESGVILLFFDKYLFIVEHLSFGWHILKVRCFIMGLKIPGAAATEMEETEVDHNGKNNNEVKYSYNPEDSTVFINHNQLFY